MNTQADGVHRGLNRVLAQFPLVGSAWQCVAHPISGFSGARLWRIVPGPSTAGAGQVYCLRRWPEGQPARERLEFIHNVLKHVAAQGISFVPVPLDTSSGSSVVEFDGTLWELTPWLPGTADYIGRPSAVRLAAAMTSLARFHLASDTFLPASSGPSSNLSQRLRQLQELGQGKLNRLAAAIYPSDWPGLARLSSQFAGLVPQVLDHMINQVASIIHQSVRLQPCIRDIWHEHVLYTGDTVAGLVDFGAMRIDSVACDVARLMGSMVGDDGSSRAAALAAYEQVRPMSSVERELVSVFDQSTVVLGGTNWIRWVFLENRQFDDRSRVEDRLRWLLRRLEFQVSRRK